MYPATHASTAPSRPAVIVADSGERLTYGELDERSRRLARLLRSRGLRRGDHMAVLLENHPRYFEVMWAALRSGLYVTPINWHLTPDEAAYVIEDCGARALVTSVALGPTAAHLARRVGRCETRLVIDGALDGFEPYEASLDLVPDASLADEPSGALMLYSSGTTGRPKGVLPPLPDRSVREIGLGALSEMLPALWGFGQHTIYLSTGPLYHGAPSGFTLATQSLGGTVVVMPQFDPRCALEAIERYGVTHSQWVPTMFTRLLRLDAVVRRRYDLSSHRVAIHAAAPCPVEIKQQMFGWWGPILHEYYGGSEMNGMTYASPEDWLTHPGTVGRPILGTVHICAEDGREVPAGRTGLLYFERPSMPFEYHNDPEKTASARHPAHPNWSTLGDVGRVDDDGFVYLTDRASFTIISGGVNIYPQEIENVLVLHPRIVDVAVIGVPNTDMGEEVKAVVELVDGTEPSPALVDSILAHARDHLARYKLPRSVDFVDALPRLPTGKLAKGRLRDRYWADRRSRIV